MRRTTSPAGYIINLPDRAIGTQGLGYDYVLSAEGVSIQASSNTLTARIPVARAHIRGLARAGRTLRLAHGPMPADLFRAGLAMMTANPCTESFFAIRFDGSSYRLVVPKQRGSTASVLYQPPPDAVAEFHSHCSMRAFFSATDDADEQAFRIYGVVGRADTPTPELALRVGIYGYFGEASTEETIRRPHPLQRSAQARGRGDAKKGETGDMHTLNTTQIAQNPWITVVGCGGTGGFVAESLCRLLTGTRATITLVDHDRVEPHNLLRQNFTTEDVGRYKSAALAERLAREFDRVVGYSTLPFRDYSDPGSHTSINTPGLPYRGEAALLIGCVDNAAARKAMADTLPGAPNRWMIDAGNDKSWGQVLIGNVAESLSYMEWQPFDGQRCNLLPAPTLQRPDLLTAVPSTPPEIDCAAALDLADQDPTINQTMAALVMTVVQRILTDSCPFMALYADMDRGTVNPIYATPTGAARVAQRHANEEIASLFEEATEPDNTGELT